MFSPDGKLAYIVHIDPKLNRVSDRGFKTYSISAYGTEDMKQHAHIAINYDVISLANSSLGVVALVRERQDKAQVWLLSRILEVKAKVAVGSADFVMASANTGFAYAIHFQTHVQNVHIIDLQQERLIKSLSPVQIPGFANAKRSPAARIARGSAASLNLLATGKHMIGEGGGSFLRLSVSEADIAYEEIGPRVTSNTANIVISDDGKYFASSGPDLVQSQYGAVICDVNDLTKPIISIPAMRIYAFGPGGSGVVYGKVFHGDRITAFDMKTGAALKRYDIDGTPVVHPKGARFFAIDRGKAKWVVDPTGLGKAGGTGAPVSDVKPVVGSKLLRAPLTKIKDATLVPLKLEAAKVLPFMHWSADGASAIILQSDGMLRRVSLPDLTEKLFLDLGTECSHMTVSAEGLVITARARQELIVVDEATFEVKNRVQVGDVERVATNRKMSLALAVSARGRDGRSVRLIDLQSGAVIHGAAKSPLKAWREDSGVKQLVTTLFSDVLGVEATPDGKAFSLFTGSRCYLFDIQGTDLILQLSPGKTEQPTRFYFDPDGVYVRQTLMEVRREVPVTGKSNTLYRTEIFPAANLTAPALVINCDYFNPQVNLDAAARQAYALGDGGYLVVYNAVGSEQSVYRVDDSKKSTNTGTKYAGARQLLVHPAGHRMLALTTEKIQWISLDGASPDLAVKVTREEWLGNAAQAAGAAALADIKVVVERSNLRKKREAMHGGAVTPLTLAAGELVPAMPISIDEKFLFLLEKKAGVLHQVSLPNLINERLVELGKECVGLALSSEGVVAATKQPQELWVFDVSTLNPKRVIPVPGMVDVTAAAGASVAFVSYSDRDKLAVIDLARGEIHATLSAAKLNADWNPPNAKVRRPVTFGRPQLTPDGKTMICVGVLFEVDGLELKWKGGAALAPGDLGVPVSSDSQWAAGPTSHSGRQPSPGMRLVGQGMTIVALNDPEQPIAGVGQGTALAFDIDRGLIYIGEKYGGGIGAYEMNGRLSPQHCYRTGNYDKPDHPARHLYDVQLLQLDRATGNLLALTKDQLLWVEPPALTTRTKPVFDPPVVIPAVNAKQREGRPPAFVAYSSNGREGYEFQNGRLSKIDAKTGKEIKSIDLRGLSPFDVVLTKQFVVLLSSSATLIRRSDMTRGTNVSFHSGIGPSIAASEETDRIAIVNWDAVTVADCGTGKSLPTVQWKDLKRTPQLARPLPGFDSPFPVQQARMPVLSPDGNYLFVVSNRRICRIKIVNNVLLLDMVSPPDNDRNSPQLSISPDGKHLAAWPVPVAEVERMPHQYLSGVAVYDVNKLDKPLFVHSADPTFARFDSQRGSLLVHGDFGALAEVDLATQKVRQYKVPPFIDTATTLEAIGGDRVLLRRRTGNFDFEQWLIELPR
ncbi:MAG: hypothetical protein WD768_10320 [Phycisphaeraceae bacterium]